MKQWFIQVDFSLQSLNSIVKRTVLQTPSKRDAERLYKPNSADASKRGTNLAPLFLNKSGTPVQETRKTGDSGKDEEGKLTLIAALIGLGIFLLIAIFIIVIFVHYRRKQASPPPTPSGTITVMSTSTGQTRVISNAHIFTNNNHLTEV